MNILCHISADFVGWWQTFLDMVIIEWTELEHILERMCTYVEHNWDKFWKTLIVFGLVFHRFWTYCAILRHILSVFWTDLEMILYGFSTDFVLISSRFSTNFVQIINRYWTVFGQTLIRLWKDFAETADIFWHYFDHVLNIL